MKFHLYYFKFLFKTIYAKKAVHWLKAKSAVLWPKFQSAFYFFKNTIWFIVTSNCRIFFSTATSMSKLQTLASLLNLTVGESLTILEILKHRMCITNEAFSETSLQSEIIFAFPAVRRAVAKNHASSCSIIVLSLG